MIEAASLKPSAFIASSAAAQLSPRSASEAHGLCTVRVRVRVRVRVEVRVRPDPNPNPNLTLTLALALALALPKTLT